MFPKEKTQQILDMEVSGRAEYIAILDYLQQSSLSKRAIIEENESVLKQLYDVRKKITETVILAQLDISIKQKTDLIEIENNIFSDIRGLVKEIEDEITVVDGTIKIISNVIASFPSSDDSESNRKYEWDDVQSLQSRVLSTAESFIEQEAKLRNFVVKFESVMQRKGLLLGDDFTKLTKLSSQIKKQDSFVVDGRDLSTSEVKSDLGRSRSAPSPTELFSNMKKKDKTELAQAAGSAAAKTALSAATLLVAVGEAAADAVMSNKEQVLEQGGSTYSLSKVTSNLSKAAEIISQEMGEALKDSGDVTPADVYLGRVSVGVNKIKENKIFASSLSEAKEEAQVLVEHVVSSTRKFSMKLGERLKNNRVQVKSDLI